LQPNAVCSKRYHVDLDKTGGLKYCLDKSLHNGNEIFGIVRRERENKKLTDIFEKNQKSSLIRESALSRDEIIEQGRQLSNSRALRIL